MKKIISIILSNLMIFTLVGCNSETKNIKEYKDAKVIQLNEDKATIDNLEIQEFDYTWHVDPRNTHEGVKDAPAEYYTGEKASDDYSIYIDHELYYYPKLDTSKYSKVNYDGEKEWAYYYEDGVNNDYIFATLPCFENSNSPITSMMFDESEANKNKVLHIKQAGTYVLQGKWNGQINIDLGEESFDDETQIVTILLNGVDITCSVAPAIIFENAYECDNAWEERIEAISEIDTSNAGVNVIVCDDTVNNVDGKNIYRMLKSKYKDDDSKDEIKVQKKVRKIDAPFYSCVSMNINGEEKNNGVLNITSSFEGLDTELHLTINGGIININSQDDGINVNEDNVSIVTFNGGTISLNAAMGAEGDGVDSNGFVVINGSTLYVNNIRMPDNAIDSEDGIKYISGDIYIDDNLQEIQKGEYKEIGKSFYSDGFNPMTNNNFDIKEIKEKINDLPDNASIQDVLDILGMNNHLNDNRPFENEPHMDMPNKQPFNDRPMDNNIKPSN